MGGKDNLKDKEIGRETLSRPTSGAVPLLELLKVAALLFASGSWSMAPVGEVEVEVVVVRLSSPADCRAPACGDNSRRWRPAGCCWMPELTLAVPLQGVERG